MENLTIMPHEFLYLICNSTDKLDIINESHHPLQELRSKDLKIFHWELNEKSSAPTKEP